MSAEEFEQTSRGVRAWIFDRAVRADLARAASLGGEADIEVWDDEIGGWRQVGHFDALLVAQMAVEAAFQAGEHVRTGGWLYEAPNFLKNPDDIGMWWAPGTWREADEVLYVPLEANAVPVQEVPARPDAEEAP